MARYTLSISPAQIQELARAIAGATEASSLRVRLLRDALGVPFDDPRVVEATAALDESKWVRELAAD